MSVKPRPDGYHTLTPYLTVKGVSDALDFYKRAFNAKELYRLNTPDGHIAHAEFQIGDSPIMIGEEMPGWGHGPLAIGGSPVSLYLYIDDVDALFAQAVEAGATVKRAVADQFYGDRSGHLIDPFGHHWGLATHVEDVPPDQIHARFEESMKAQAVA